MTRSAELGALITKRRLECRMTQRDLAAAVAMSPSNISHIECGRISPSIDLLHRMAGVLQVPLSYFFQTDTIETPAEPESEWRTPARYRPVEVVRPGTRKRLIDPISRNIQWELLSPDHQRTMEFLLLTYQPGARLGLMSHEGEEAGYMLEGSLEVMIEGEVHRLEAGESIYFDCIRPHEVRNPSTDQVARAVWVISPPSF